MLVSPRPQTHVKLAGETNTECEHTLSGSSACESLYDRVLLMYTDLHVYLGAGIKILHTKRIRQRTWTCIYLVLVKSSDLLKVGLLQIWF